MSDYTPEQFARLPKWAQHRITCLERDLLAAERHIQDGPRDSNATLNPYSQEMFTPLGRNVTVQFGGEGSVKFTVKHDGDKNQLDIHTHGEKYGDRFVVVPRAGNSVVLMHTKVDI